MEKNGAPQESGSTKEKIGLLNVIFDIPNKSWIADGWKASENWNNLRACRFSEIKDG